MVRLGEVRRDHALIDFYIPLASVSTFSELTSPNPAIVQHAETTDALHTHATYFNVPPKFIRQFSVYMDELTLYAVRARSSPTV